MAPNLDRLVKELKKGQCAIFLGHGILPDPTGGRSRYAAFCDGLATEAKAKNELIDNYYPEEAFFLFKSRQDRGKVSQRIENFYTTLAAEIDMDIYQKLAEIPASLYISVSPDNFLEKKLGADCHSMVFNDPDNVGKEISATKEKPLVYHIFGASDKSNSLLLSHDDLFKFFKNILSEESLPTTIRKFFKEEAEGEAVFLGFTFKTWYVQLLLRIFNLNDDNEMFRSAYLYADPQDDEKSFAAQNFKVEYVQTGIKEFIDTLHARCKAEGILRPLNVAQKEAGEILLEDKTMRKDNVRKKIKKDNDMLFEYEQIRDDSNDPKERARCQREIDTLQAQLATARQELNALLV